MKPITVGMALEGRARQAADADRNRRPAATSIGGFTISDTHNYGTLTVEGDPEVQQRRRAEDRAEDEPHEMWDTYTRSATARSRRSSSPAP
jgi:cell division protein FtsI (penicillin-binding protein 3)